MLVVVASGHDGPRLDLRRSRREVTIRVCAWIAWACTIVAVPVAVLASRGCDENCASNRHPTLQVLQLVFAALGAVSSLVALRYSVERPRGITWAIVWMPGLWLVIWAASLLVLASW